MGHFNSKAKGSEFERKICRIISEFWSEGKYRDLCWRSASSGARGTVAGTRVKGYYGDLVAVSPLIEPLFSIFCIEAKHYKEFDLAETLTEIKGNKLFIFWRQTLKAAIQSNRMPVLIVKPNFYDELLIMRKKDAFLFLETMTRPVRFMSVGDSLIIINFQRFLSLVNRALFLEKIMRLSGVRSPVGAI